MGKLQKTRDEIETKYTWDLTLIYKTDKEFEKDYEKVSKEINDITKYKGVLFLVSFKVSTVSQIMLLRSTKNKVWNNHMNCIAG